MEDWASILEVFSSHRYVSDRATFNQLFSCQQECGNFLHARDVRHAAYVYSWVTKWPSKRHVNKTMPAIFYMRVVKPKCVPRGMPAEAAWTHCDKTHEVAIQTSCQQDNAGNYMRVVKPQCVPRGMPAEAARRDKCPAVVLERAGRGRARKRRRVLESLHAAIVYAYRRYYRPSR